MIDDNVPPGLEHWSSLYVPPVALQLGQITTSLQAWVAERTPLRQRIYSILGIPVNKHGHGLYVIPNPPRGGRPRCSMSTLIHLVIIGSPRKCLLGYEIISLLQGHFQCYRYPTQDWQVRCNIPYACNTRLTFKPVLSSSAS